jgi:hypothetical protein
MKEFNSKLQGKSEWKVELSLKEDILVSFISFGNNNGTFVFGESSDSPIASDYFFQANSYFKQFILPIEIFSKNKDLYTKESLGIFELVKPDFVQFPNYYKKRLVSNLLDFAKLAKNISPKLKITSPTGEYFDPKRNNNG